MEVQLNWLFQRLNEIGGVAVAPSILSANFTCLETDVWAVEECGADMLHLDVMDGHFVPNLTFGPIVVEAVARLTALPVLTHLMIEDPGSFVESYVKAGSSIVSFHWEACGSGHEEIIDRIHELGCGAGIAINPDTPLSAVKGILHKVDCLITMSVFPGFGGQSFISSVLEKIEQAARLRDECGYGYVIEVDGGINPENAADVRKAGGQILVAGTAVFRSESYTEAIAAIRGKRLI